MANAKQLWPTLKRLLAYGSPWRKSLMLGVLMLWVAAAAEVAGPALVSYFIDNLVAKGNIPLALAGGLAAVYILLQLSAALSHYVQLRIRMRSIIDSHLRSITFSHRNRSPGNLTFLSF